VGGARPLGLDPGEPLHGERGQGPKRGVIVPAQRVEHGVEEVAAVRAGAGRLTGVPRQRGRPRARREVDAEQGVERGPVLGPLDEGRSQGGAELSPVRQVEVADRGHRVQGFHHGHRDGRVAQPVNELEQGPQHDAVRS
jgi:hypothetical protein